MICRGKFGKIAFLTIKFQQLHFLIVKNMSYFYELVPRQIVNFSPTLELRFPDERAVAPPPW